ncbi:MAG TPA: NUDIX domain-containing protein, partial [Desulfurivibrionaceae bacterium]|nr:NUDIX domain-containing protein [Desulfurivibrionaceae bacterium]
MATTDPRCTLQTQIEKYRAIHPGESSTAGRFLDFMAAHDDCFLRSCRVGHITGSAFIVDPSRARILLVHHAKLDKWLQPGGHCEPGETASQAALREAWEETGVQGSLALGGGLFDLDAHTIPARGEVPEHTHWDARYLVVAA